MKYGLIGEKLGHSFSKIIHEKLVNEPYDLIELEKEQLAPFMLAKGFRAINVTIPYKQAVMAYLDEIHPAAQAIGAVNTVVNRGGKLIGYNTDYSGLKALIEKNRTDVAGLRVLILGSGGTSLTARQVALDMGAAEVQRVSRSGKGGAIDYAAAYAKYRDADVIINTTPVGMYPHLEGTAVDLEKFHHLKAVFDVVYNPLCTDLVLKAQQKGITAEGGLYMLVAQAVYASEYFHGITYEDGTIQAVFESIQKERQNIALTGMPGSGKSTVGNILAKSLERAFYDTDNLIEQQAGMSISEIFKVYGEKHFRDLESAVIASLAAKQGAVIATGGGAVLREENVFSLGHNGKIFFLNRDIDDIVPTDDRPLALNIEALRQRFTERYDTYCSTADKVIEVTGTAAQAAELIGKEYLFDTEY